MMYLWFLKHMPKPLAILCTALVLSLLIIGIAGYWDPEASGFRYLDL